MNLPAMLDMVERVVPPDAKIIVASGGETSLVNALAEAGWSVSHFPADDDGNYVPGPMGDGDVAIQQLEWMRFQGARYLVASEPVLARMRGMRKFKYHLDTFYAWVARPPAGVVYALWKPEYPGMLPARDKLPIPPPYVIYLVGSHYSAERFFTGGMTDAQSIRQVLAPHRPPLESAQAILDFGCGCGRVIRHWAGLTQTRICGTDYNPLLIDWCQKHLRFAEFQVNGFTAPLNWPDDTFDVVYTISIFTHLQAPAQAYWMRELSRVTKPGGHIVVSVHGRPTRRVVSRGAGAIRRR
jgi:SAM-dependent methyltransferase